MRKKGIKVVAILLMLCMLLPQTALAVTRQQLEVTITESEDQTKRVTGTSGYLNGSEGLTAEVVAIINSMNSQEKLKTFGSPAMKAVMNAGLDAYAVGGATWSSWVTGFNANVTNEAGASTTLDLKAKLTDLGTRVNALAANVTYAITYTPTNEQAPEGDPARGNTYTVSVKLVTTTEPSDDDSGSSSSGGSTQKPSGGTSETVKNEDGSTTETITYPPVTKDDGTVVESVEAITKATDGTKTETKTETETKPDGTKTETKTETETKPDGTKTESKTETETKPDGTKTESKTETETKADGTKTETKTETETKPDGTKTENKTETETKADGTKTETKTETETKADGTVTSKKTAKGTTTNGTTATMNSTRNPKTGTVTTVSAAVSAKDAAAAAKNNTPVTIPVVVDTEGSTTVDVALPSNSAVKVEIPVSSSNTGLVAVMVDENGNETVMTKSVLKDGALMMNLEASGKVKLVDNSKSFQDVPAGHWAGDAVAFVSARNLFQGVSNTAFAPNRYMTRGMLATVLHRLENKPEATVQTTFSDVANGAYYSDAIDWASEKGILTGYDDGTCKPDQVISRQQLVSMLYRYAGSPAVQGKELTNADASSVSGYAEAAMKWAVENGIVQGKADGTLAPTGLATRAQVAAIIMRYCNYEAAQ